MTKFQQILNRIEEGTSFSWGLDGFSSPEPSGELQLICQRDEVPKIGFYTQQFMGRCLYFENLRITYKVSGDYIQIFY
jgi:hypothetical protein